MKAFNIQWDSWNVFKKGDAWRGGVKATVSLYSANSEAEAREAMKSIRDNLYSGVVELPPTLETAIVDRNRAQAEVLRLTKINSDLCYDRFLMENRVDELLWLLKDLYGVYAHGDNYMSGDDVTKLLTHIMETIPHY